MGVLVKMIGRSPGINRAEMNRLVREYGRLELTEAKKRVDELLAGQRVVIDCESFQSAERFIALAKFAGAVFPSPPRPDDE